MPVIDFNTITFRGMEAEVTQFRVPRAERDPNKHYYEMRHSDDWCEPISIERGVMINHAGTFVTNEPIDHLFDSCGDIDLTEEETDYIGSNL